MIINLFDPNGIGYASVYETKSREKVMVDRKNERPACFGILDKVFPKVDGDMRSTPESCFPCYYKTECLKQAMESSDGLMVKEEKIDMAYRSGLISFFERWSRKKYIQKRMKDKNA